MVPDAPELEQGDPADVALENARRKARAVEGERVLAADTVVALGERLYGKPADQDEARDTLRALSSRWHTVITGVCLRTEGREETGAVETRVLFRCLDERLVDWYLSTGEWRGRAGGYAIQGAGAAIVARIDGDYTNVVGLPVGLLIELNLPLGATSSG